MTNFKYRNQNLIVKLILKLLTLEKESKDKIRSLVMKIINQNKKSSPLNKISTQNLKPNNHLTKQINHKGNNTSLYQIKSIQSDTLSTVF